MKCVDPSCLSVFDVTEEECPTCHRYQGKLNVRHAAEQRDALQQRYDQAKQDAQGRGLSNKVSLLEQAAANAEIVCTVSIVAAGNIFRNRKYLNYYHRDFQGVVPSHGEHVRRRSMVDARLFTAVAATRPVWYGQFLHHFALTVDGSALASYGGGGVAIYLADCPYVRRHASLLDMNSFHFFSKFGLGQLSADEPYGHRARWEDRELLVVAKIAPSLTSTTTASDIGQFVLRAGTSRDQDEIIEVHVYDERGLPIEQAKHVRLLSVAATPDDQEAWKHVLVEAQRLSISVS